MIYHQQKHPPRGKTSYRAINHCSPESWLIEIFLLMNQRVECLLFFPNHCRVTLSFSVLRLCICECVFVCVRSCVFANAWGCFYVWLKRLELSEKSFNVLNCHNLELAQTGTQTHWSCTFLRRMIIQRELCCSKLWELVSTKSIIINCSVVWILLHNFSRGSLAWCSNDFSRPCFTVRLCPSFNDSTFRTR